MTLTVTHAKVDALPDNAVDAAAGKVLPSDWNADHVVSGSVSASLEAGISPITSGTAGAVLFENSSNKLGEDAAKFFWDDSVKFLGIGTNANVGADAVHRHFPLTVSGSGDFVTALQIINTTTTGWDLGPQGNGASPGPANGWFFTYDHTNDIDGFAVKTDAGTGEGSLIVNVKGVFGWCYQAAHPTYADVAPDTGMSRIVATQVGFGNGTTGDMSGGFAAAYGTFGYAPAVSIDGAIGSIQQVGDGFTWAMTATAVGTNSLGSAFAFAKTRGADPTVQTAVQSGDQLCAFYAYGSDGTVFRETAYWQFVVDDTVGASNVPTAISFVTGHNAPSLTERLRISSDGAICIGSGADTSVSKLSTGVVGVGNGTQGDTSGTLALDTVSGDGGTLKLLATGLQYVDPGFSDVVFDVDVTSGSHTFTHHNNVTINYLAAVGQSPALLFREESNSTQFGISENGDAGSMVLAQNGRELYLDPQTSSAKAFAAGDVANFSQSTVIQSYAVGSLPAAPVAGQLAAVNDALVPVVGNTVGAGGAAFAMVCYNGAAWKVFVI